MRDIEAFNLNGTFYQIPSHKAEEDTEKVKELEVMDDTKKKIVSSRK